MKKISITVTYVYDVEIDENNNVVKDYDTTTELVNDLANYRFSAVLPVINSGGVKITNIDVEDVSF